MENLADHGGQIAGKLSTWKFRAGLHEFGIQILDGNDSQFENCKELRIATNVNLRLRTEVTEQGYNRKFIVWTVFLIWRSPRRIQLKVFQPELEMVLDFSKSGRRIGWEFTMLREFEQWSSLDPLEFLT